jgi:hypothetical protein
MKVLRTVGDVQLNEGQLMAKGLNNLFNTKTKELSFWLDDYFKDELLKLSDDEFLDIANIHFENAKRV